MSFLFSTDLDVVLGCILKDRRTKLNLEQSSVAQMLSLQPSTLSKIESGSTKITVEYIAMLCGFYELKLSNFFDIVEKAVQLLQDNKILVYTPKTIQYATARPKRRRGTVPLPFGKTTKKSQTTNPPAPTIDLNQEQLHALLNPLLTT